MEGPRLGVPRVARLMSVSRRAVEQLLIVTKPNRRP